LAADASLGDHGVARLLSRIFDVLGPHANGIPLHRFRKLGRTRRGTLAFQLVRDDAEPLGRNDSAVAGAASPSAYFYRERQPAAFAFCMFFFFENWLYTAAYMADARAMALPLVTIGDSDFVEHDWSTIFSSMGLLQYDTLIAGIVRLLGWGGMLACVVWLANRLRVP
jgi:hypothetical protein